MPAPTADPGFSVSFPFARPDRCMAWNLGLEITEARPIEPFPQIHFGYGHGAPILRLRDDMAFAIEDRRLHPMLGAVGVGATHDEHMVLAGTRRYQHRIASGHRERNDFGTVHAQLPRHFWKKAV